MPLLVVPSLAASPALAQDPAFCPGNRADNPSFEFGFSVRQRPEEIVANTWHAWFEALPGVGGINYAPDFTPRRIDESTSVPLVLDGSWSQELATEDSTHVAGLWQQIEIPFNSQVHARAYGYGWASESDNAAVSEPPGLYSLAVGIDPLGGTNPMSTRIVWSPSITVTDAWVPIEVDVAAEGPTVTLFLEGHALEPLSHNVSRWDAVCFRVLGAAGEPTEPPTATPPPTRTLAPGEPTFTPSLADLEVTATHIAEDQAATQTALSTPLAVIVTQAAVTPTPTTTPPPPPVGIRERVADNAGVGFLAVAGFLIGVALALGYRSRRVAE